jgi:hypothetical protein
MSRILDSKFTAERHPQDTDSACQIPHLGNIRTYHQCIALICLRTGHKLCRYRDHHHAMNTITDIYPLIDRHLRPPFDQKNSIDHRLRQETSLFNKKL